MGHWSFLTAGLPPDHQKMVVIRFVGNADVPVRSQRKSRSYADEDVRVPSISSVGLKSYHHKK